MEQIQEQVAEEQVEANPEAKEKGSQEQKIEEKDLLLEKFVSYLPSVLAKQDREAKLRATKAGLFLDESLLDKCIEVFISWHQKETNSSNPIARDKALKRIFNTEHPLYYYIVEGRHSAVGHVIMLPISAPQKLGVQLYHGQPLDAVTYLHPKDPILDTLPNVESKMGKLGLEFHCQAGKWTYVVGLPALTEFAQIVRLSKKTLERNPEVSSALRSVLKLLPELLAKARPSKQNFPLLIPGEFRGARDLTYLTLGSLVMVIDRDRHLVRTYELRGKNRHQFLTHEFNLVRKLRRGPQVSGMELTRNDKVRFLAFFKLQEQRYQLLPKAFSEFSEFIAKMRDHNKKLASFYTIFDCVKIFGDLFMSSTIIDSRDQRKYLRDRNFTDLAYLRISKGIIFVIGKQHIILDCFTAADDKNQKSKK